MCPQVLKTHSIGDSQQILHSSLFEEFEFFLTDLIESIWWSNSFVANIWFLYNSIRAELGRGDLFTVLSSGLCGALHDGIKRIAFVRPHKSKKNQSKKTQKAKRPK